ncbi:MAG TPA: hypothetical protein QGH10_24470, partial [Armatimonadota bacterium]|nr:hypothetical protein [Armatimonadota bacterium]
MTSRERLIAAMRLQDVDRTPIHVRGVNAWDDAWIESRHESYASIIEAVKEHGDYFVPWGVGGAPFYTASEEIRYESEVIEGDDWNERVATVHTPKGPMTARYLSSNRGLPGMQMEYFVKDLDDVQKFLSVPYVPLTPDVGGFFERTDALGDEGVVTCDFCNPITPTHDLMGSELLGIWSRQERDTIRLLVNTIAERLRDQVRALLDADVGPVFRTLGHEYCIPPLM